MSSKNEIMSYIRQETTKDGKDGLQSKFQKLYKNVTQNVDVRQTDNIIPQARIALQSC